MPPEAAQPPLEPGLHTGGGGRGAVARMGCCGSGGQPELAAVKNLYEIGQEHDQRDGPNQADLVGFKNAAGVGIEKEGRDDQGGEPAGLDDGFAVFLNLGVTHWWIGTFSDRGAGPLERVLRCVQFEYLSIRVFRIA